MFTFLIERGRRWQIELRAKPVRRSEPELQGGMYESLMAEVGGWAGGGSDNVSDDNNSRWSDGDRAW